METNPFSFLAFYEKVDKVDKQTDRESINCAIECPLDKATSQGVIRETDSVDMQGTSWQHVLSLLFPLFPCWRHTHTHTHQTTYKVTVARFNLECWTDWRRLKNTLFFMAPPFHLQHLPRLSLTFTRCPVSLGDGENSNRESCLFDLFSRAPSFHSPNMPGIVRSR